MQAVFSRFIYDWYHPFNKIMISSPAASAREGNKSTSSTRLEVSIPWSVVPGTLIIIGTRVTYSLFLNLAQAAFSPIDTPWSLQKAIMVSLASPRASKCCKTKRKSFLQHHLFLEKKYTHIENSSKLVINITNRGTVSLSYTLGKVIGICFIECTTVLVNVFKLSIPSVNK